MSDQFEDEENDSEGIRNLRKQFDAQAKELKELREFREGVERQKRSDNVAGVLKAKGVNPAAAKFYTADDTSDEAINKWLEENGEVFGVPKTEQSADEQNAERVINNSYGPAPVGEANVSSPLGNIEQLRELYRTHSLEELQRMGKLPVI